MKIYVSPLRSLRSTALRLLGLFLCGTALHAQSVTGMNPYDALGRVLLPFAEVFSPQGAQRAFSATLVLEGMTGLQPELAGTRVDLALQPPDRALLRGPLNGEITTICRVGQEVWISPGAKFQALAATLPAPAAPKKKKKKKGNGGGGGLAPMVLPFPPQQLALLPVLFQVKDEGMVGGLRVLDVRLMPELARSLGVEEWTARLFLDRAGPAPAPRLARLELSRPGWQLALRVERLEFAPELPASTWVPGEPASADVLRLTGPQARQWLELLARQFNPPGK